MVKFHFNDSLAMEYDSLLANVGMSLSGYFSSKSFLVI